MQVTHISDKITHAVIGGEQTIEFGINADAAFFNMLSNTLYSNKRLAVARETLCNAWDAHIAAGCTDIPVQVTVGDGKFIIRDAGLGIHKDKMGPVYGIYGGSTKQNDGTQTGGFGLGCKAPFSITDHFEVISCHEGTKTIYNLSKSSAKVQGKMGIVPIASFPTQERGLTVTIPISPSDEKVIKNYVEEVAANGGMFVHLNGNPVNVLPFADAKHDFLILKNRLGDMGSRIMVRYGNVVYPVENNQDYRDRYQSILAILSRLGESNGYRIVFQAPPHSISVTPSRESLSMEDKTIASLVRIFDNFIGLVGNSVLEKEYVTTVRDAINTCAAKGQFDQILTRRLKSILGKQRTYYGPAMLFSVPQIAETVLKNEYPSEYSFVRQDLTMRVAALIKSSFGNRGLLQTYRQAVKDADKCMESDWLSRSVLAPLLGKMSEDPLLDPSKLFIFDKSYHDNVLGSYRSKNDRLYPAKEIQKMPLEYALPYLRNIVVISYRKTDLEDRLECFPDKEKVFHTLDQFLVYIPSRKTDAIEAARALFQKRGMTVIDLTAKHTWDPLTTVAKEPKQKRTPRKGWPTLSSVLVPSSTRVSNFSAVLDKAPRSETPEFYVEMTFNKQSPKDHFSGMTASASYYIAKLFGDRGVIVSTILQKGVMVKNGVPELHKFLAHELSLEMQTNPLLLEYYPHSGSVLYEKEMKKYGNHYELESTLRSLLRIPEIRQEFGLKNNLTEFERTIKIIWDSLNTSNFRYYHKEAELAHDFIGSQQPSPEGAIFCNLLANSFLVSMLDMSHIQEELRLKYATDCPERTKIINLLITALRG